MIPKETTSVGRRNGVLVAPIEHCDEEAAYCMGWLVCNGYIVHRGKNRSLLVKGEEAWGTSYLQRIATCFNALPTVIRAQGHVELRIRSEQLVSACIKEGMTEHKGDRGSVSEWLATSPAFWRGVFDSSCTYVYEPEYEDGELRIGMPVKVVGTTVVEGMVQQLNKYLETTGIEIYAGASDNHKYVKVFNGNRPIACRELIEVLYKDNMVLTPAMSSVLETHKFWK